RYKRLLQGRKPLLCRRTAGLDMRPEVAGVRLHPAELHGFYDGNSYAGADIAHEIENAGGITHALARHRVVGYSCQRNEDQPESGALQHQRPPEIPEPN